MSLFRSTAQNLAPLIHELVKLLLPFLVRYIVPGLRAILRPGVTPRTFTLLLLGVVWMVQVVLMWLLMELVLVCIDLAELWLELVAEHLEITQGPVG